MEPTTRPIDMTDDPEDSLDPRECRICGCTDDDCSDCVERTGQACSWSEPDLCSACAIEWIAAKGAEIWITDQEARNGTIVLKVTRIHNTPTGASPLAPTRKHYSAHANLILADERLDHGDSYFARIASDELRAAQDLAQRWAIEIWHRYSD